MVELGSFPTHMSTKPGIIDIDIHSIHEQYILSIGKDQQVILFDKDQQKVIKKIEPLPKKSKAALTVAKFAPGLNELFAVVGCTDSTASLWQLEHGENTPKKQGVAKYVVKCHTGAINDLTF